MDHKINGLVAHMHGGFNVPLRERTSSEERCYGCHEHGTYDEIVEMPADLGQEFGANPYASRYGEMDCRLCHKMHKESPLIEGCYGCHHEGTFESCSTCHG